MKKIAKAIDEANPDIVIIGGDIFDAKGLRSYKDEFNETFGDIASRFKTYAVIGNHELYTGAKTCIETMSKAGITVLLDDYIMLDDFIIAGRLDFHTPGRKELKDILPKSNSKPVIVIDHEPNSLGESVDNGIFLHLSGHTHGGQIFPMNLMTRYLYGPTGELDRIQRTNYYITPGAGFWGPPYRIGTSPEIVLIEFVQPSEDENADSIRWIQNAKVN